MAEPAKKTPARKPAAKRGPTKAAALKALGITKEDLEILAKAKEPVEDPEAEIRADFPDSTGSNRRLQDKPNIKPDSVEETTLESLLTDDLTGQNVDTAPNKLARSTVPTKPTEQILHERIRALEHRLLNAESNDSIYSREDHNRGKRDENSGLGIAETLNEIRFGERDPKGTATYARNNMYSPFRFKTESGKQYSLAPRGYRGDFKVIHKDDLEDSNILDNANRGLIELLTREQADQVITKQHTNATSTDHLKSFLRTPEGKEYAPGAIKVASEEETKGIVVARTQELDKLQQNGKGIIDWGEVHNPTDQVKSDDPYAGMSEDERLAALDKATRDNNNPLAGLKVTIG